MAQWLRALGGPVAPPADIAQGKLEAQGYVLVAPLQRRPGVYLADVRAGPGGYQRLVIDDRNGGHPRTLHRSAARLPSRIRRPVRAFDGAAALGGAFQPLPVPRFPGAPNAAGPGAKLLLMADPRTSTFQARSVQDRLAAGACLDEAEVGPDCTQDPVADGCAASASTCSSRSGEAGRDAGRAQAGAEDRVPPGRARTPRLGARMRRLTESRRPPRPSGDRRRKRDPRISLPDPTAKPAAPGSSAESQRQVEGRQ